MRGKIIYKEIINVLRESGALSPQEISKRVGRPVPTVRKCLTDHNGKYFENIAKGVWKLLEKKDWKKGFFQLYNLFLDFNKQIEISNEQIDVWNKLLKKLDIQLIDKLAGVK